MNHADKVSASDFFNTLLDGKSDATRARHLLNVRGHGDRFLPVLPGLLAEVNGARIRDL
jgi:hypothetical protein